MGESEDIAIVAMQNKTHIKKKKKEIKIEQNTS